VSDSSSASPDQAPYRFAFSLSEEEIWAFRKYAGRQINRSLAGYGYFGVLILTIVAIGLAVYAAYCLDLFDIDALPPVLTTAYLAFAAGVAYAGVKIHWQSRRLARALHRLSAIDNEQWEYSFDDAGMVCRSQTVESRVVWRAFRSIEHNDTMMLLWANTAAGAYFVPARVFTSAPERTAFVRWASERIAAAHSQTA
jgi:hypothetical protein